MEHDLPKCGIQSHLRTVWTVKCFRCPVDSWNLAPLELGRLYPAEMFNKDPNGWPSKRVNENTKFDQLQNRGDQQTPSASPKGTFFGWNRLSWWFCSAPGVFKTSKSMTITSSLITPPPTRHYCYVNPKPSQTRLVMNCQKTNWDEQSDVTFFLWHLYWGKGRKMTKKGCFPPRFPQTPAKTHTSRSLATTWKKKTLRRFQVSLGSCLNTGKPVDSMSHKRDPPSSKMNRFFLPQQLWRTSSSAKHEGTLPLPMAVKLPNL